MSPLWGISESPCSARSTLWYTDHDSLLSREQTYPLFCCVFFFWYVSCCEHRLKSKTALITKRWRKKGSQLLPEDDAREWAGRLGVHSKNQLHLLRVGWLAMESVHLTCPCCSEGVVLRYVSGYWLNLSLKIANISQIRVEIQGPQLQELRHVSFFWVNGPEKRLQCIPQENAGTEWTC